MSEITGQFILSNVIVQTFLTLHCALPILVCSDARNFVANPNLRNDMLRAIDDTLDGCSRMCNINNAGYGTYSVTGDGDLTNVLPSHVCEAVDSSFNFEDGDESCVCKADEGNGVVSGCAYCSAQVTFIVDNCLDIVPSTLSPRRLRNRH